MGNKVGKRIAKSNVSDKTGKKKTAVMDNRAIWNNEGFIGYRNKK